MNFRPYYLFTILLVVLSCNCWAQTSAWLIDIGSPGNDQGYTCKVAPNGNVCVAGKFTGTVDLDPGPGVYNITSAGLDDIFIACYTSAGAFLWGCRIGGTSYDAAQAMAIDGNSDVIVVGYYRGTNIDFDPGPGTFLLSDAGSSGPITFDGEGFAVKLSSTGAFQWAKSYGGSTVYDCTFDVTTDPQNNVYICGLFTGVMVVTPSITFNSTITGKGYIIKYNPGGTLIWADAFGLPGYAADDCEPRSLVVRGGYIYQCGVLQGTADLDPGPGVATLTASGLYDGYLAKYDTAGHYVNAILITGTGNVDYATTITMGPAGELVLGGLTNSPSVTFYGSSPGSATLITPSSGSSYDFYLARYDTNLNYVWATMTGGLGDDICWHVEINNSILYATGSFSSVVDFDPSTPVFDMFSAGGTDMFLTEYNLSGTFICGFRVGGTPNDEGWGIALDPAGALYTTGYFSGSSVDFDPGTPVAPLSSAGGTDGYFAKYLFSGSSIAGTVSGDTICPGQTPYMTLHISTGGTGPYTVNLTDGTSIYTYTGVLSGTPFPVAPIPTVTTTYTITSIDFSTGSDVCVSPSGTAFGTVTIAIDTAVADIHVTHIACGTYQFSDSAGGASYHWNFGGGTTDSGITVSHTYTISGSYTVTLTATDTGGCIGVDTLHLSVNIPYVKLGGDTTVCFGDSFTIVPISVTSGLGYHWSTGAFTDSITVDSSGNYWLTVTDENGCTGRDTIKITVTAKPFALPGIKHKLCTGDTTTLYIDSLAGNIDSFYWNYGGATIVHADTSSAGPYIVRWDSAGIYVVSLAVSAMGCPSDTIKDTVSIGLRPDARINVTLSPDNCMGDSVHLEVDSIDMGYTYYWQSPMQIPDKTAADIWALVTQNTSFTLVVSTPYGCKATNTVFLNPDSCCQINMPTAFTPNGDGYNDVFRPVNNVNITIIQIKVFNRWGECVFESHGDNIAWDGTFNGEKQDMNVFYYYVKYKCINSTRLKKGDVTLVR